MNNDSTILIAGAGVFGLTAALELNRRGHAVTVVDPGPVPHPLASSTDISKVIRMEYGSDLFYTEKAAQARSGWLRWNEDFGEQLYHETGLLVLAAGPLRPGSFEGDSLAALKKQGHKPKLLDAPEIARDYPAWNTQRFSHGFFHQHAGFAESGQVITALARVAVRSGVNLRLGSPVVALLRQDARIYGVQTASHTVFEADATLIAAGAWSPLLVPELQQSIRVVGQPVFHLHCPPGGLFDAPRFPVFTADISNTGWYGFPRHPHKDVIKIAHHGVGRPVHPGQDSRPVSKAARLRLRDFLSSSLPVLRDAEIVYERLCLYCDSLDGHFFIDAHPELDGLFVATGGSGHGFKFAPLLGDWIADTVEGQPRPDLQRFAWRQLGDTTAAEEAARCWNVGFGSPQ